MEPTKCFSGTQLGLGKFDVQFSEVDQAWCMFIDWNNGEHLEEFELTWDEACQRLRELGMIHVTVVP
jgi:hypothetical protein